MTPSDQYYKSRAGYFQAETSKSGFVDEHTIKFRKESLGARSTIYEEFIHASQYMFYGEKNALTKVETEVVFVFAYDLFYYFSAYCKVNNVQLIEDDLYNNLLSLGAKKNELSFLFDIGDDGTATLNSTVREYFEKLNKDGDISESLRTKIKTIAKNLSEELNEKLDFEGKDPTGYKNYEGNLDYLENIAEEIREE